MENEQISILSIIIAFISVLIASASYKVAKKALSIEEKREKLYSNPISFDLIKGLHIYPDPENIIYIFIVSLKNLSSSNKSVSKASLNVLYTDKQEYSRKAIFQHNPDIAKEYTISNYEFAGINTYLQPHEIITRGFIFKVTKSLIKENYVDILKLAFEDNDGNTMFVESILTSEYKINSSKK